MTSPRPRAVWGPPPFKNFPFPKSLINNNTIDTPPKNMRATCPSRNMSEAPPLTVTMSTPFPRMNISSNSHSFTFVSPSRGHLSTYVPKKQTVKPKPTQYISWVLRLGGFEYTRDKMDGTKFRVYGFMGFVGFRVCLSY